MVEQAVDASGFEVAEVVSGGARGADRVGEEFAARNGLALQRFPNVGSAGDAPRPLPESGSFATVDEEIVGTWEDDGKGVGHFRNQVMAYYADRVVAIWDGRSPGTRSMIEYGREVLGPEHVHVHRYR